jgi:hypothetical protein
MRIITNLVRSLVSTSSIGRRYLLFRRLVPYLSAAGWLRSVSEGLPVDAEGNALPWYTYPSIGFISGRIKPNMRVFEYGSGNSTLWWSERVASVVACEHDKQWFTTVSQKVPPTVDYRYCKLEYGGEYCRLISFFPSEFDCIIIDGRDRVNCAKNAVAALNESGVIIWDNSDRDSYQEGFAFLLDNGFRRIDFWGLGPINGYQWCTSIFYRESNCFMI